MSKILAASHLPLTDEHRAKLTTAVPGAEIIQPAGDPAPEQLADAEFILGNVPPALLGHCTKLRLVQLNSAGTDGYLTGALPAGTLLTNATGAYGLSISEHLLAMLLSLMRNFPAYQRNQQKKEWRHEGGIRSVWGSTILVLGLGDIGGEFARKAKALGAVTIGVRRAGTDKPDYLDELYTTDRLDELLPRADVVAMSLPSTPATVNIMSRERLALLKKGAYLLNVGRGSALDQDALCDALESGRLAGAGLDVTEPEPLPAGHRLWDAPNLLLTPHASGGFSLPATVDRIVEIAAHNFAACLAGRPVRNQVDFETGYRKLPG